MIVIEEHIDIRCTVETFVEFVLDIERYARVDDKIAPILWSRRDGDLVEFACRPKLAGFASPGSSSRYVTSHPDGWRSRWRRLRTTAWPVPWRASKPGSTASRPRGVSR